MRVRGLGGGSEMVGTVSVQPTHYAVLGLNPGASTAEIAAAFERELRRPRRFGDLADISAAFETLRDPIRREAYDAALGLTQKWQPKPTSGAVRAAFLCPASGDPLERGALALFPLAESAPQRQPDPAPQPVLAEPAPTPVSGAATPRVDDWSPTQPVVPLTLVSAEPPPSVELEDIERTGELVNGSNAWRRPAVALGGLVAGVVLLGAWAGWEAGNDGEQQLRATVKMPLSTPEPQASSGAATAAPSSGSEAANGDRLQAPPPAAPHVERPRTEPPGEVPEEDRLSAIEDVLGATAPQAAVPQAEAPPAPSSAAMPLSNRAIAGTLARIGYACGEVASTSTVEGAGGVFKITCTSGQSYLATRVRGRYRFRRLSSR